MDSVFWWAGGIAAIIIAGRYIWTYLLRPIHRFMIAFTDFLEAQPTLISIATEFKPNSGKSLRDQVDSIKSTVDNNTNRLGILEIGQKNMQGQLEEILNHLLPDVWDGSNRRKLQ
jgi:hypothetical protein